MEEVLIQTQDRINPMRISDNKTGATYELDFNRESIRFAENRGFEISTVLQYPVTKIPELFYYAFRKNHKNLAKSQTDKILEQLGGVTSQMLERLIQLYNQAQLSHLILEEEDLEKNSNMTVEL